MANKVSTTLPSERRAAADRRSFRYKLLDAARKIVGGRIGTCLWAMSRDEDGAGIVTVSRRVDTGQCTLKGIKTCGSVWGCPVCAPKVSARRALEVQEVSRNAEAEGAKVYMAAFTIPHDRFQSAKLLREGVAGCFKKLQQGRKWKQMKEGFDLAGMCRSMEVTHGNNGWHPHLHVLFYFEPGTTDAECELFGRQVFGRWIETVERVGLGSPSWDVWQFERVRSPADASGYVAKWALELTLGQQKKAKGGNRTPWQLLEDAMNGDKVAAMLYRQYVEAFHGARQLTWSRGLKKRWLDAEELTDEEIAAEDEAAPEAEYDVVYVIHKPAWFQITNRGLVGNLMQCADEGGAEAISLWLRALDIRNEPDFIQRRRS